MRLGEFISWCLPVVLTVAVQAADPVFQPQIEGPSAEGKQAIDSFRLAPSTGVELVAAEPNVANPVAFAFDEQGRIYVCETFRQKKGVEDNRGHMYWLMDDLKALTVEDRRAYMIKHHPELQEEWTANHDRIRQLSDSDGDGRYETATVFAEGFNDLVAGTGAGVLTFEGAVYYTCIPELWKLVDTDNDGVANDYNALYTGFGVRFAFRGHDMHGLALGPDGRIYFSIGDRGYNVETPDGRTLVKPDTGAVFRCERDGSNLEVFAYGLRNPQELAFDDEGRLFTGDNNSDSGDKARWVYVAEGSDSGWRMYYQYLDDRGPWNRERMWYPYQEDDETTAVQPAFILPPIANLGDGPSGLTSYYGVGLPDRYEGHFFMADFRGQAANSGIRSFANEPDGAGFKLVDSHEYLWQTLVTDVDFGYDGQLYFSDWVNGWDGIQKGRIYRQVMEDKQLTAAGQEVAELFKAGFSDRTTDELVRLLDHADRRVRQRSQIALAEKDARDVLVKVALKGSSEAARRHALWGLWEIARKSADAEVLTPIAPILKGNDAPLIAQALRVIGDSRAHVADQQVIKLLAHQDARVAYTAAIATGKLELKEGLQPLLKLADARASEDEVIRHAVAMGLVGVANADGVSVDSLTSSNAGPAGRLAIVVALRRLQSPAIAKFLNDDAAKVVLEAARGIHDELIEEALPALAKLSGPKLTDDALIRRVINANYLVGERSNFENLLEIALNPEVNQARRVQALEAMSNWGTGSELDAVTGQYRPRPAAATEGLAELVAPSLEKLFAGKPEVQKQAVRLAAELKVASSQPRLQEYALNNSADTQLRITALKGLDQIAPTEAESVVGKLLKAGKPELRSAAREIAVARQYPQATELLRSAIDKGSVSEQQSAIGQLQRLSKGDAESILSNLLKKVKTGSLPLALHLDVMNAAEAVGGTELEKLLAEVKVAQNTGDLMSEYRVCLEGGDAERGKSVFFGNAAASCRRCHVVNGQGGGVGPDLSAAGKKYERSYLLESIVNPDARIAKGFETVLIVTIEGKVISGIIREETDEMVTLVKPLGEIVRIPQDDIEDRAPGKSGMPADLIKQLTKAEIRDLVSYLATLKTEGNVEAHGEGE